jgi:hypothetical protein
MGAGGARVIHAIAVPDAAENRCFNLALQVMRARCLEHGGPSREVPYPKFIGVCLAGEMDDRTPRKPSFGWDGQIASFEAIGAMMLAKAYNP